MSKTPPALLHLLPLNHSGSDIKNDSSVSGATVKDALETLSSIILHTTLQDAYNHDTSANPQILFDSTRDFVITGDVSTEATLKGASILLTASDNSDGGDGGDFIASGGSVSAAASATAGSAQLLGGDANNKNCISGSAYVSSGDANEATGGISNWARLQSGGGWLQSGDVYISTGTANVDVDGITGISGNLEAGTGDANSTSGNQTYWTGSSVSDQSGVFAWTTGNCPGDSGSMTWTTGNSASGQSGSYVFTVGTGSTEGIFSFDTSLVRFTARQTDINIEGTTLLTFNSSGTFHGSIHGDGTDCIFNSNNVALSFKFNNAVRVRAGTSSSYARVGGVLVDFTSDVGNSTTTETDIYSYTVPANVLIATGDKLSAFFSMNIVGSGTATRTIKIYFAGTVCFNSGALSLGANGNWQAYVELVRTSSSTARVSVGLQTAGATTTAYSSETDLTGSSFTGTNILKLTAQAGAVGAATNDITGKHGYVELKPAA
jgi:hypothetical protein